MVKLHTYLTYLNSLVKQHNWVHVFWLAQEVLKKQEILPSHLWVAASASFLNILLPLP